ncbi:hypothetical protein D3C77_371150 [compost metagenome]
MNSLSSTTSLPAPSAKIFDFTAAALSAHKKRQDAGVFEVLHASNPLVAAAKADPSMAVVDADWFLAIVDRIPEEKLQGLVDLMILVGSTLPGANGTTNANTVTWLLADFFRCAEREGQLHTLTGEPKGT